VRLEGPTLPRRREEELPSEGIVLGAIQVPASGRPLVFLNDHPTTGGYPVVGVVAAEDLAVCAQLRPGSRVRLVP
jgi:allophanate hydrolase subunit 2